MRQSVEVQQPQDEARQGLAALHSGRQRYQAGGQPEQADAGEIVEADLPRTGADCAQRADRAALRRHQAVDQIEHQHHAQCREDDGDRGQHGEDGVDLELMAVNRFGLGIERVHRDPVLAERRLDLIESIRGGGDQQASPLRM